MGFPRLLSIFYCTFHPTQGPKVLYEVPEGSILSKTSPLVDFDSISEYLIPKVELCSKLVTISTPTCKVIGFPINLEHKKFQRNALMFNLAFVFDKDAEISSYEPVVRKMARVLKALEKESEFLSRQTRLAMTDNGTLANMASSVSSVAPSSIPLSVPLTTTATTTGTTSTPPTSTGTAASSTTTTTTTATTTATTTTVGATTAAPSDPNAVAATVTSVSNLALDPVAKDASTSSGTSSALLSSDLTVPVDTTSPVTIPTSLPSAAVSITSTALVSSPPAISGSSIATVLTAPPSLSPFPPSKPGTVPPSNGGATNSATKPPATPTLLQQNQIEHGSGMQNLIEQLIEDLNSYCECQIPIDSANTINLKLFPTYPNPAPVYDYQVPISTVNLEALIDVNWDMTMQRITGYINGVSPVKRIAEYADVETGLARMCMEHLLYYGCIIMVDLFQFKNIYAVKMEMMRLTEDVALQNECVSYVTLPDMHAPSFAKIFSLYCSLQYGVVLQDWIETNQIAEYNIDVRRFISFGVIKGFLYRVHKYPILDHHEPVTPATTPLNSKGEPTTSSNPSATATSSASSSSAATPVLSSAPTPVPSAMPPPPPPASTTHSEPQPPRKLYGDTLAPTDQNNYMAYNQHQQQPSNDSGNSGGSSSGVIIPLALRKLLDGQHHYDELCTQFGCSVREMDQILATDSRVKFIYR